MASTWPDLVGDELAPRSNSVHGDFQRLPAESQERFDEGQRTPGVRRLGLLGSIALGAYTLAFVFGRIGQLMSLLAEHPFGVICGAGWLALQRIPFSLLAPMLMVVAVLNWDYFSAQPLLRDLDGTGLTVIVTGANSGLGLATSESLASLGATVIMGCRSQSRCDAALHASVAPAAAAAGAPTPRAIGGLDLDSLVATRRWARRVRRRAGRRDKLVLVCNAGLAHGAGRKTREGVQLLFGSMYLAHTELYKELSPTRVVHSGSDTQIFCGSIFAPFSGACLPTDFFERPAQGGGSSAQGGGSSAHGWASAPAASAAAAWPRSLAEAMGLSLPSGVLGGSDLMDYPRSKAALALHAAALARRGHRAYSVSFPWVQTAIVGWMRMGLDWSRLGVIPKAETAVAPLLFAALASDAAIDAKGHNGGSFVSGSQALRPALAQPWFWGQNTTELSERLWEESDKLRAELAPGAWRRLARILLRKR